MAISMSDCPLVVVGSGFFGATIARLAAEEYGVEVLVLERRDHVGGNSFSRVDEASGIEYHVYGSHIFHTSSEEVWNFVNRFTEFNNYRHRVMTLHKGRVFSMPMNLMTINAFFGGTFTPDEAKLLLAQEIASGGIQNPQNLEEKAISLVGRRLYEAFIRGYTQKQWETDLRKLPPDIITRLPVRMNYNDFYFSDRFEGIPLKGYAAIFERMLNHEKITVNTQCDYFAVADELSPNAVIVYTGPIDAYFNYALGHLGWRTLDLKLERVPTSDFQGTSVMNYADLDAAFTRIHEFKHYHPERRQSDNMTLIMKEYSRFATKTDEPYYPINTAQDKELYGKYKALAEREPRTIFGGRLGTYRYLDMHQAIGAGQRAMTNEVLPALKSRGHL